MEDIEERKHKLGYQHRLIGCIGSAAAANPQWLQEFTVVTTPHCVEITLNHGDNPHGSDGVPLTFTCTPDVDDAGLMFVEVLWNGSSGILTAQSFKTRATVNDTVTLWHDVVVKRVLPLLRLALHAVKLGLDPTAVSYSIDG